MQTAPHTHLAPRPLLPAGAGLVVALLGDGGLEGLVALGGGHAQLQCRGEALAALDAPRLGAAPARHAAVRPVLSHPAVVGRGSNA